jgi:ubiquinone/menaquinone biosynthesis C-methylase UbiE
MLQDTLAIEPDKTIRACSCPDCYVCGGGGQVVYENLVDDVFFAPGQWNVRRCSDDRCGLMWIDPMPIEEDIAKAYENYLTHDDSNSLAEVFRGLRRLIGLAEAGYLAWKFGVNEGQVGPMAKVLGMFLYFHPARRANLGTPLAYLPRPGNREEVPKLLDVGCGAGAMLDLTAAVGWESYGIDFDPQAVRCGLARGRRISTGSLAEQLFPADYFDAMIMSHFIEHIHDPRRTLSEAYRVLAPGGRLVVFTPNNESVTHRTYGQSWSGLHIPRHLHIFTVRSLVRLLYEAGFKKVRVKTTARFATDVIIAGRAISRTGKPSAPRTLTDVLWASGGEILVHALCQLRPGLGEEIAIAAEK